jgi:hypothetical protein
MKWTIVGVWRSNQSKPYVSVRKERPVRLPLAVLITCFLQLTRARVLSCKDTEAHCLEVIAHYNIVVDISAALSSALPESHMSSKHL